ncbi:MAG: 3'-5' exonuclease [Streptococcaceae bacterium]|jgi:ATP-dependent DNA helicase DinG|nr:3'-5' exonuclease [Streptococcaceae bacterium]
MTRYAIVDLEATDRKKSGDKIQIIQVGIVLMENGVRVGQFAADVNPHEKLSHKIKELTGLTDVRLASAPDFSVVAAQIMLTLEDCVFVAHNVKFDYGLLTSSLLACGYTLEMDCVDTVELARVLYPTFERYGLDYLDERLNLRNNAPHTALSDALAEAELLRRIQEKLVTLPRVVVAEMARHAGGMLFETGQVITDAVAGCPERVKGLVVRGDIALKKHVQVRQKANQPESFKEALGALGFTVRERQQELADIIAEDLGNGLPSFIEAQAGMGKTYGYLLANLVAGKRMVVSVPTKVLQSQLMDDVAPGLFGAFGTRVVKLIGTANYVSLEKLRKLLVRSDAGKNFEIFKMKLLVWLTETETGELSELSAIMTSQEMLAAVAHTGQVAKGELFADLDFWAQAQEAAKAAQVIVVNHAYLVARLADYPETFLEDRVLVVDEAQQLFSVLEGARQEEYPVIEDLLLLSETENRVRRRLVESLFFQLGRRNLKREKLLQDAGELGLSNLTAFLADASRIYWAERNVLRSSPEDFYDFEKLVPAGVKAIFVGAGLAFSEENPMLPEFLGYEIYNFYKLPQEVASNQKLLIATDGLQVRQETPQAYGKWLAERLSDLTELKKPIIVLFTSQLMLDWTAKYVNELGIHALVQDARHRPEQLKHDFDEGKAKLLLATGMFWEGVDFEQQKEAILVIPRLPFATPDDILTKKFAVKFDNAFYDFNVPMATLKIRQAMGRVNRKPQQRSTVLVLDARLAGKSYAKRMRRNLHEIVPIETGTFEEMLVKSKDFLGKNDNMRPRIAKR